jgi:outer membrane murein-binding lipoprotein Lpp
MRVRIVAVSLPVVALAGCASTADVTTLRASSTSVSSATETAQAIVDKIEHENRGKATGAAYAETTGDAYDQSLPPESRNGISVGSRADKLLVIKVVGAFTPVHSEPGIGPAPRPVSTLIAVYDEALGVIVENTYLDEPSTADVPNAPADAAASDAPIYADLRALGQPTALTP